MERLTQEEASSWTREQARSAYRKRSLRVHPDKAHGSVINFSRVTEAYEYLRNTDNPMDAAVRGLPSLDEPRPQQDSQARDMRFWNTLGAYVMPGVSLV